jgi:hypothetical protein
MAGNRTAEAYPDINKLPLGFSLVQAGDHVRGRAVLDESLVLCQALGDPDGIAITLDGLGLRPVNWCTGMSASS